MKTSLERVIFDPSQKLDSFSFLKEQLFYLLIKSSELISGSQSPKKKELKETKLFLEKNGYFEDEELDTVSKLYVSLYHTSTKKKDLESRKFEKLSLYSLLPKSLKVNTNNKNNGKSIYLYNENYIASTPPFKTNKDTKQHLEMLLSNQLLNQTLIKVQKPKHLSKLFNKIVKQKTNSILDFELREMTKIFSHFQKQIEVPRLMVYRQIIENLNKSPLTVKKKKEILQELGAIVKQQIPLDEITLFANSHTKNEHYNSITKVLPFLETEYRLLQRNLQKSLITMDIKENKGIEKKLQQFFSTFPSENQELLVSLALNGVEEIEKTMEKSSSKHPVLQIKTANNSTGYLKIDTTQKNYSQYNFLQESNKKIVQPNSFSSINPCSILFPSIHGYINLETSLNQPLTLLSTYHINDTSKLNSDSYKEFLYLKKKFLETYEKKIGFSNNEAAIIPDLFNQILPLVIFEHTAQIKETKTKREAYKPYHIIEERILSSPILNSNQGIISEFSLENILKELKKRTPKLQEEYSEHSAKILINGDIVRKNTFHSNSKPDIGLQFIDPGGIIGDPILDIRRYSQILPENKILKAYQRVQKIVCPHYNWDDKPIEKFISNLQESEFEASIRAASAYAEYGDLRETQYYMMKTKYLLQEIKKN